MSTTIHIDPHDGSDLHGNGTERAPFQTWARAKQSFVDGTEVRLRRGGQFSENIVVPPGVNGMIIAPYGEHWDRPWIPYLRPRGRGFRASDLYIEAPLNESGIPVANRGIEIAGDCEDAVISDSVLRKCGVTIGTGEGMTQTKHVQLHGVFIHQNHHPSKRAQGIYASGMFGLWVEDCLIFDNGLGTPRFAGQNHGIYFQHDSGGLTVRNSLFANNASHGVQTRAGGIIEDSLFLDQAYSIFLGGGGGRIARNVVLGGRGIDADHQQVRGIEIKNASSVNVLENIVAHPKSEIGWGIEMIAKDEPMRDVYLERNIVHGWRGVRLQARDTDLLQGVHLTDNIAVNGEFDVPQGWSEFEGNRTSANFVDPSRVLTDTQLADLRAGRLSVADAIAYIREGFAVRGTPLPEPEPEPETDPTVRDLRAARTLIEQALQRLEGANE